MSKRGLGCDSDGSDEELVYIHFSEFEKGENLKYMVDKGLIMLDQGSLDKESAAGRIDQIVLKGAPATSFGSQVFFKKVQKGSSSEGEELEYSGITDKRINFEIADVDKIEDEDSAAVNEDEDAVANEDEDEDEDTAESEESEESEEIEDSALERTNRNRRPKKVSKTH